jgi:hypothetical protein
VGWNKRGDIGWWSKSVVFIDNFYLGAGI